MSYKKTLLISLILCFIIIIAVIFWGLHNPENLRVLLDKYFMAK